jgi:hypothetical protein
MGRSDDGLDRSDPLTVRAKMLRTELLRVKADLERELELLVLDCAVCGRTVHYVGGLGVKAGCARRTRTSRDAESSRADCLAAPTRPGQIGPPASRFNQRNSAVGRVWARPPTAVLLPHRTATMIQEDDRAPMGYTHVHRTSA